MDLFSERVVMFTELNLNCNGQRLYKTIQPALFMGYACCI